MTKSEPVKKKRVLGLVGGKWVFIVLQVKIYSTIVTREGWEVLFERSAAQRVPDSPSDQSVAGQA
jgi:hypothetical protein